MANRPRAESVNKPGIGASMLSAPADRHGGWSVEDEKLIRGSPDIGGRETRRE
jgi:hypothetical protein